MSAGGGRRRSLYCGDRGRGGGGGNRKWNERDRKKEKKELRRRGLFNSNLPTLSVCAAHGDH